MSTTRRNGFIFALIIAIILFISAVVYGIFLYMDLNEKRTMGYEETKRELLNQTNLVEIFTIDNFNGEKAYHVVHGENESGEEKIIFYPLEGKEKRITTIDQSEIVPKEQMRGHWQQECINCQFVDITPALLDEEAFWELTYYDEKDRYVFDYRSIYDGSPYEEIRYLRKFN
jgi:uncharacterized protein YpmB